MTDDEPGLLLARITIERRLTEEGGDQLSSRFEDRDGDMPPLVEILGMLAMTSDTAIRAAMGEAPEDEA